MHFVVNITYWIHHTTGLMLNVKPCCWYFKVVLTLFPHQSCCSAPTQELCHLWILEQEGDTVDRRSAGGSERRSHRRPKCRPLWWWMEPWKSAQRPSRKNRAAPWWWRHCTAAHQPCNERSTQTGSALTLRACLQPRRSAKQTIRRSEGCRGWSLLGSRCYDG